MYNIKKTYLAIVLGGAVLYSKGIIAAPYLLNTQIPLGAVNGRIVNNTVRISKTLAQPTLVNIYRSNIDNGLNFLLIKNAKVIKQSSDEVHIEIKRALPLGSSITHAAFGLWFDGKRIPLNIEKQGNTIKIAVPPDFNHIELRVTRPLLIELPRVFKGNFEIGIDIEGLYN